MTNHERIATAVQEIAQWSKDNFGEQEGDGLKLGRVAPLLGIFEEIYSTHLLRPSKRRWMPWVT